MSHTAFDREALRNMVRRFAESEVRPRTTEMVSTNALPRDLYQRCGELGVWRLNVPVEHGGDGKGLTEAVIVMEELARVSPALALTVEIGIVSLPLLLESAARSFAASVMSGDTVIAAGSTDPTGQRNTAEWGALARDDDDSYVLNGTRLYVTNASECDLFSVSGLDDTGQMRKFYVDVTTATGVEIAEPDRKHGMAGNGGATITLTDCRVPKPMSTAFSIGSSEYYYYVYCLCAAEALGAMQGVFDAARAFLLERTSDFAPIASKQAVAHKLARLRLQIEMARSLVYDAATTYDDAVSRGEIPDAGWHLKAEAAKVCVSEIAHDVATECIVLHGGLGYHDPELHRFVGDALCYRIMDLTNEIHLDNVATLIGLPTDPRRAHGDG